MNFISLPRLFILGLVLAGSLAILLLSGGGSADAGIVSNGTFTRDVETGIEYLRVGGITRGLVVNRVVDFNTHQSLLPAYPDFRLATSAETISLLNAVGLGPSVPPTIAAHASAGLIQEFLGPGFPINSSIDILELVTSEPLPSVRLGLRSYSVWVDKGSFQGSTFPDIAQWNGASARSGALLVRNYANGTSNDPASPTTIASESIEFQNVSGEGAWFDFDGFSGTDFRIEGQGGTKITHIAVPENFSDDDNMLTITDPLGGMTTLSPGDLYKFDSPVDAFEVGGIRSNLLSALRTTGTSLPLFLRFDQASANFIATTAIPEPATWMLAVVCTTMAMFGRRLA